MDILPFFIEDEALYSGLEVSPMAGEPGVTAVPAADDPGADLLPLNTPADMAYIIFTSGTTGRPTGSIIEHGNVVRLMVNQRNPYDFNQGDVWTLFHSYCFDFSVWEMYGALLFGGKLLIIPPMTARDTRRFLEILVKEHVTVLNQTPSAFYNLMDTELSSEDSLRQKLSLRYVIFGGEELKPGRLKSWQEIYPQVCIVNMFGITETTVHVTYKEITLQEISMNQSNIGTPIPTLQCYVMDANLQLLPIGVAGELCVGGAGVCRGYLNRVELTVQKFIPNPFRPQENLYRSGDLVRQMENGEMEYLGRLDHQVKIRGFRIEMGEIEACLAAAPGIRDVVVTVLDTADKVDHPAAADQEPSDRLLCAYYTADQVQDSTELRRHLAQTLPDYMIPAYFVPLDAIPLTVNGKVDRSRLPYPQIQADETYRAPETPVQKKLAEIWAEILNIDFTVIGLDANFFELGGHSLKATILISRIYKELNVKVELPDMFQNPTIRELAALISQSGENTFAAIQPMEKREYYPLSSAQKRLFILQQMDLDSLNYNVTVIKVIEGDLGFARLEDIFRQLIRHHESLRTSFRILDGHPVQQVADEVPFTLEHFAPETPVNPVIRRFVRPFDLTTPPLLRVGLMPLSSSTSILMVDKHHIISDGISMNILIRDFMTLYQGGTLTPLRLQYKDYCGWQNSETQIEAIKKQEVFWLSQFDDDLPVFHLPLDEPRPAMANFEGGKISFDLSRQESAALEKLARDHDTTLFMVILAIFNIL